MKLIALMILSVACSSNSSQLSKKAQELEVFPNKPQDCNVVGKVVGVNDQGSTELATNHALNQAADLKASGIHINQEVPNGNKRSVYATAYKCN